MDSRPDPRPRRVAIVVRALSARVRLRAASESGIALIEILISAVLLALIVVGTFTAFDAAGRITTDQQQRSQANGLAQQDQDRLRGLQVAQLPVNQTRTVTLNGTNFTIVSTADYTTDASGTSSCGGNSAADYVKTTSVVSWPTLGSRPPIKLEGIITPPIGGSLVVQVADGAGNPVGGMAVNAAGPTTASGTTTAGGCAIFGALPAGDYNVSVSQAGYVDKDGNTSPPASQQATTVVNGATDRMSFQYDLAAQITASFDTKWTGQSTPVASTEDTIVVFNSGMTLPGFRNAGTSGVYGSSVAATNLFPFPSPPGSPYTVYAGSCPADAPSANGQAPDPSIVLAKGGSANVVLHIPALVLKVYTGTSSIPGALANTPNVVAYDQGCGGSPPTAGGTPAIRNVLSTNSTGALVDPGVAYGVYKVCADGLVAGKSKTITSGNITINQPVTGTTLNLYLGSGVTGSCP